MSRRVQQSQPIQGVSSVVSQGSCVAAGDVLVYTCPASRQARISYVSTSNFAAAPTIQMQLIVGGVTVVLNSGTVAVALALSAMLNAGDICKIRCTTGAVGGAIDGLITAEEFQAQ